MSNAKTQKELMSVIAARQEMGQEGESNVLVGAGGSNNDNAFQSSSSQQKRLIRNVLIFFFVLIVGMKVLAPRSKSSTLVPTQAIDQHSVMTIHSHSILRKPGQPLRLLMVGSWYKFLANLGKSLQAAASSNQPSSESPPSPPPSSTAPAASPPDANSRSFSPLDSLSLDGKVELSKFIVLTLRPQTDMGSLRESSRVAGLPMVGIARDEVIRAAQGKSFPTPFGWLFSDSGTYPERVHRLTVNAQGTRERQMELLFVTRDMTGKLKGELDGGQEAFLDTVHESRRQPQVVFLLTICGDERQHSAENNPMPKALRFDASSYELRFAAVIEVQVLMKHTDEVASVHMLMHARDPSVAGSTDEGDKQIKIPPPPAEDPGAVTAAPTEKFFAHPWHRHLANDGSKTSTLETHGDIRLPVSVTLVPMTTGWIESQKLGTDAEFVTSRAKHVPLLDARLHNVFEKVSS